MRFKGLDLNLLVALDTLLETRNVSRAAERLNLSQPAISAALGRIRQYFGDEILVMRGKRMYPTAFAESMLPRIRQTLRDIDSILATSIEFEAATSQRTFRIVASDYIVAAVLFPLVARLAELAPSVRIDIVAPDSESLPMLENGKVDLVITPENFIARDQPAELLFEERHVIAGWAQNSFFDAAATAEAIVDRGHIAVGFAGERTLSFADIQLDQILPGRRVEIVAPSFTAVPWLLEGTGRLAPMHARLFRVMQARFPIASAPMPFPFPIMREMMQHHHARNDDDGLSWLRAEIRRVAAAS
jgi:LysR family transcriptional regulator, nod-box dependent transcriptional activator